MFILPRISYQMLLAAASSSLQAKGFSSSKSITNRNGVPDFPQALSFSKYEKWELVFTELVMHPKIVPSGNIHVLVRLQAYTPFWICLHIIYDQRQHFLFPRPLRLKKKLAVIGHRARMLLRPVKVTLIVDDYFQFIGKGCKCRVRRFEFLWRKA